MSLFPEKITPKDTKKVFNLPPQAFDDTAMTIFRHQAFNCAPYKDYLSYLGIDPLHINEVADIPFLPVECFKRFDVIASGSPVELVFESSSTTGTGVSRHQLTDTALYDLSYSRGFEYAFGAASGYCHLALLPGYLERQNSSLVYQVHGLMKQSSYQGNGFYLDDYDALYLQLVKNEEAGIPTVLWGVSFALWDFAENYDLSLSNTIVIETGGMKGRRREITREELHNIIARGLGVEDIASEYGMTELLSQAYSKRNGLFHCPPWMKVMPRDINDPLSAKAYGQTCGLNVIDLANINSCSFIATADLGRVFSNGSFEVLGRFDHSETRGCNLMIL